MIIKYGLWLQKWTAENLIVIFKICLVPLFYTLYRFYSIFQYY